MNSAKRCLNVVATPKAHPQPDVKKPRAVRRARRDVELREWLSNGTSIGGLVPYW